MKKIAFCLLLVVALAVSAYSGSAVKFKGTVIYISSDTIEIKKGKKEVMLDITPGTTILLRGKKANLQSIVICQKVRAEYVVKDSRKELVTLDIVSDSYCAQ